jgi:3-phosphoshikimate 1-carboxyvinyltransferase
LLIEAEGLSGGEVTIDGAISSQFLTALLMAAPLAEGPVTIHVEGTLVSRPYIDITLHVMEQFGVTVEETGHDTFSIQPATYRAPASVLVEGDASSASYFLALGALLDGPVRVEGVGSESVQGDVKFAEVLDKMGARVTLGPDWIETSGGTLRGLDIDLNHIPDAAMTIATMALFAEGPTVIRNIYNWRVKETDRISAMATELRKVGAEVKEGEDFIAITPPKQLRSATIDTYDDHRMAMCFSLASCGTVPIMINDPGCVAKTFPTYWELFDRVTR